jgi:peptidoglycan LD-endopeptidase LytH
MVAVSGALLAFAGCAAANASEHEHTPAPAPTVTEQLAPRVDTSLPPPTRPAEHAALARGTSTTVATNSLDASRNRRRTAPKTRTQTVKNHKPPPVATAAPPVTAVTPSYRFPVEDVDAAGYAREHHDYPAADIFAGCGATVVAPVDGTLLEVRRVNQWDPAVDNPATRGGLSVTMLGVDGVRYYFAHFQAIAPELLPGSTIRLGDELGQIGDTGRASACHLHFAISPPCPGKEWSVRRGVVEPWDFLDAWRQGEQLSPTKATQNWQQSNPDACTVAMADPDAAQS